MVKEKRTEDNLPLKSIWETSLVLNVFRETRASPKHAYTLWNYLVNHPETELSEAPFDKWMCGRKASTMLKNDYSLFTTRIVQKEVSVRGDTTKLIVELQDGHRVGHILL